MTLLEALARANSGALIARASDKHADWPWRVSAPVDLADVGERLAALRHGYMLDVAGLERRGFDGRWTLVGRLRSHEAQASDWVETA
jgi:hypothetical protein